MTPKQAKKRFDSSYEENKILLWDPSNPSGQSTDEQQIKQFSFSPPTTLPNASKELIEVNLDP